MNTIGLTRCGEGNQIGWELSRALFQSGYPASTTIIQDNRPPFTKGGHIVSQRDALYINQTLWSRYHYGSAIW